MEIGNIILAWDSIGHFIGEHFKPVNLSYGQRFESEHPLLMSNFNLELKNDTARYTLFGIPAEQIFAYKDQEFRFAVYVLFELDDRNLDQLATNLGYPENVPTKEEFHKRDFDFLYWKHKKFEIFVNRSHLGKKRGLHLMQIFNMSYASTIVQKQG